MSFTADHSAPNGQVGIDYNYQDVYVDVGGCGNAQLYIVVAFYQGSSQIYRSIVRQWNAFTTFTNGHSSFSQQLNVALTSGTTYSIHLIYEGYGSPCLFFTALVEGTGQAHDYVDGNNAAHIHINSLSWTY